MDKTRIKFFFKIACKREEIHILLWFLACADRAAHDRISVSDRSLSVCLFSKLADLDFEKTAAKCCSEYSVVFKSCHN